MNADKQHNVTFSFQSPFDPLENIQFTAEFGAKARLSIGNRPVKGIKARPQFRLTEPRSGKYSYIFGQRDAC
ncbi:hypothetical protein [Paenibacillus apiarius]|uniref:hypothetical protein n=1 Tax=Paenibacillus apiarius TaxID=46240 RepID=UPI001981A5E1|nr:hypothetical protein [Paenibacillus apiarius]MBN3525212.1 hypothetical protein [Paenibacillus apiarius]